MKLPASLTTVTTFSKILAMILFISLPFIGFYLGMKYQQQITVNTAVVSEVQKAVNPTPIPTLINTINWKTYSESFSWFKKSISVKYPPDWTVVKSTSSGHPNWITISAPIQNQCINISVSSEGKNTTLDNELKNATSQWSLEPDNNVISSNSFTINGYPAKIRSVSRNGINFMDGVMYIGTDPRYAGDKVFIILSSCGTAEKDIFNTALMSVSSQ